MLDIIEVLFRPLATAILWVLRALLWIGWDLFFSTIGWGIGWCVCRVLSFGRWPDVGIKQEDACDRLPRFAVELTGLAVLVLLVWCLSLVLDEPAVLAMVSR